MAKDHDEYDSPWKEAVEEYFQEFMEFYFPEAYERINWDRPYYFREQELRRITRDAEKGKGSVDKLVQVGRHEDEDEWVFVHVEVQASKKRDFAERMFTYNYRIYDRYRRPAASLAVLADPRPGWHPDHFGYELFGCRMHLDFPVVKLLDYADRREELEREDNVFAILTLAHLDTQNTRRDPKTRYEARWRLVRMLYERGWDKARIRRLFGILEWMMRLPPHLEKKLWTEVEKLEEEKHMPYVTFVEREARAEGHEQGVAEGRETEAARMLRRLLKRRFGSLPDWADDKISAADTEQLERWGEELVVADTVEDVFADGD